MITTLDKLKTDGIGYIYNHKSSGEIKQRLLDLGFIKGERITCIGKSPAGDPCAYRICETTIALRKEDSSKIEITLKGG